MAAEMISSAVVGETLNRVVSRILTTGSHGEDDRRDGIRGSVERLEMAHGRMEAVLELSTRWPITDVSLLRWRLRLKRAAEECDSALRRKKQLAVEDDEAASRSSFPRRVAHATRSLVSALIGGRDGDSDKSSSSSSAPAANVRRFERLADGASEFLKLVELGGTRPRQHAFFDPLIGRLLAGETLNYRSVRGRKFCYLGVRPVSFEERGVEAMVGFVVQDFMAPARSFRLGIMVRLSERTDVLGTMIECLQSATPTSHFRVVAEDVRRELAQLPTQDFTWVARSPYGHNKYWVDVHNTLTRWYRPNPLCCTDHHPYRSRIPSSGASPLCSTYPEQIINVHLQCNIPAPPSDNLVEEDEQPPPLNLTVLFIPHDHGTPEEEEDGVKQHLSSSYGSQSYALEAVDHLRRHAASRTYQVSLRSGHGTAHIYVEKTGRKRAVQLH
ncbi:hypothetical protein E2562_007087 [Oryza meyeriana var. granulata]|uniref:WW domain-containing protein n=1 Tax=Oryza meyeriana var. granulata TaxID=110450 RepID=A0A6G1F4Y8_9ORYZ|nr:hypothetical protein E2562_007087 [Oryza meyeriana var. granulata]